MRRLPSTTRTRRRSRYDAGIAAHAYTQGVFASGDEAVVRHRDLAHLHDLVQELEIVEQRLAEVVTMNGNQASGVQLLLCKP
jgi:hypothetical protein